MQTSAPSPSHYFNAARRETRVRDRTAGSYARFIRAQRTLAGGVSSSLRRSARPYPLYFSSGSGCRVIDVDGNVYLDYGLAWGPLILGHAPGELVHAVTEHLKRGFTFGAQHDLEFEVAEMLTSIIPCAGSVCFANSGTEVVQVALRLARAFTGRPKFIKFEGHYHGWQDNVLVSYHPSSSEISMAGGLPIGVGAGQQKHDDVLITTWNDRESVERLFAKCGSDVAALICEPLLCNSGCIPPEPGFLEFLREATSNAGALLIFDEVITGFRLALSGAQGYYGVIPDLATYAKALGGGIAVSALAGKSVYMDLIDSGKVIHAGTLNGNPVALAATKATIEVLSRHQNSIYNDLWRRGESLRRGLEDILRSKGFKVVTSGVGPVFQLSFMEFAAREYRGTLAADKNLYSDFSLALLDEGVLTLPDGRWYLSAVHTDETIDATLAAAERAVS